MPPWFYELSPEQQAACGGHAGMAPTASDGVQARIKPPARIELAVTREAAERWFFDTHGYLVIPDVMDAEWLAQANAAVDVAMRLPGGFNEFNSGGIGVDYQPGSVREPFVAPEALSATDDLRPSSCRPAWSVRSREHHR
jgi:hypothetical protein